ncbi:uncharacterized protein LOC129779987 [Toxorhynchites rutilus septentrionalis]|uniref:uncharacterized protein LOC129779987 n=1 Tax=Toxorhynchites rutilus septentrionalis TaxID=329112 RepID=UPI0024789B8C|nr:uncharacterized protein LOC129779987 [Toxorhynchites rutilus septentrionalis]
MSAMKSRGKNWCPDEDEALCRAWLDVSQDAAVGINQRADNLYDRIHTKFLEICVDNGVISIPERNSNSLKNRWHHINKCVSKFAGCLAQINGRQQSGASPEDAFKKALTLYATSEKTPFNLVNSYRILESAPKWQQYHSGKAPNRSQCMNDLETEEFRDEVTTGETSSSSALRSIGRDAAKKQKKSELDLVKSGRLLAATAQAKLADSIERTKILKRLVNHSIISVNLNGLSDVAREYYALEQQRILSELRSEEPGSFSEAGSQEDVLENISDEDVVNENID